MTLANSTGLDMKFDISPSCYFLPNESRPWIACLVKDNGHTLCVGQDGFDSCDDAMDFAKKVVRWLQEEHFTLD